MPFARTNLILLLALSAARVAAQDLRDFETILIPAVTAPLGTTIAGAAGARFASRVFVVATIEGVRFYPGYPGPDMPATIATLRPQAEEFFLAYGPQSRLGRLLYIERAKASAVGLAAYLRSQSVGEEVAHRTRLPIVRDRAFFTETANIVGVSSSYTYAPPEGGGTCRRAVPRFRHSLRVYDPERRGDGEVLVRIFLEPGTGSQSRLSQEFPLALNSREGDDLSFPAFGDVPLEEVCNPRSCFTPCAGGTWRLQIVPLTPGLRFWPIVSETDNFTQQVSLAYPE